MNLPTIGAAFWMPEGWSEKVILPCPACDGQLAVTVILGSGERVGVPCDGCGHGYDGPRGVIEEWQSHPRAIPFEIAELVSLYNERWKVRSTTGAEAEMSNLYATEAEALAVAVQRAIEHNERNMQMRQHKRGRVQKHAWSILYHRGCIKDLERQIAWHTNRINVKEQS